MEILKLKFEQLKNENLYMQDDLLENQSQIK